LEGSPQGGFGQRVQVLKHYQLTTKGEQGAACG